MTFKASGPSAEGPGYGARFVRQHSGHRDMAFKVRRATAADFSSVRRLYLAWQYSGEVRPEDRIFVAEHGGLLVGVVRLVAEHDTTVLRGMRVQPGFQRQGAGTRLLEAAVAALGSAACYCIPYAHLVGFYSRAEFQSLLPSEAPAFLAERLAGYLQRGSGSDYLIMRRPGGSI